jgi:hypothetical protein
MYHLNNSKWLFNNNKCHNSKLFHNHGLNSNQILTFSICHRCLCQWWTGKVTWLRCKTLSVWWASQTRCNLWITTLTWCTKILQFSRCKETKLWLRIKTKRSSKATNTILRWCSNQDKKDKMFSWMMAPRRNLWCLISWWARCLSLTILNLGLTSSCNSHIRCIQLIKLKIRWKLRICKGQS